MRKLISALSIYGLTLFDCVAAPPNSLTDNPLYSAAMAEGKVVIYSVTSRIHLIEELFERRYPGIDVSAFVLSSREQITRLRAEQRAGIRNADVLYLNDAAAALALAREGRALENFVPPRMRARIPGPLRQPLLSHRLSTKVLLYNAGTYPGAAPVANLWELTQPQWRRKVLMVDPASRSDYLDLLATFIRRSAALESAYRDHFGRAPELAAGVASVGEKFIRELFANELVLVANTERLNAAIGRRGQRRPPVGFGTYSDLRNNRTRGWALQIANEVNPAPGIVYPVVLVLARDAPHPAAARLLVDFMMGDDGADGGAALAPFFEPGEYITRVDIAAHPQSLSRTQLRAWEVDPQAVLPLRQRVFDLVLELQ
ncbi:ABC transporter substrate-binding protein [Exilibacterium tricleocarpae]|uniref:ABC transporter substrate-binding protein n=1 Tax=Exilibacterium tricleocarpae TaxID=2591008 RepID=A0A545TAM7_9GAMM|nr:substrate-binding domain-containing protein [Exilibacterium tricleocarpae]TQV74266.1 ABC transporter substrate-binding protein [Exilibacterium tricleocarpae]